ncbi:MAG: amino acid adenylation domain-containing protein [Richelia sp. RM1_1_1]|nr:amino acid adenylation domain-containing protein [Richelia sp. RM1_1_1]
MSRLGTAWQKLIVRHDMLRTVVLPTGEQQILEKVPTYEISILDLREVENLEAQSILSDIREKLSHQMLPCDRWPLFDIRATYLDEHRMRLHIKIDLLMMDAASIQILFGEWNQLYQNPELSLKPLGVSFRDYVINKQTRQDPESIKQSQNYWFSRLDVLPPAPKLPLVSFPSELKDYRFKRYRARLEPNIWEQLKQRGKNAGLTPSIIFLAAFAEILTVWSKNPRFTINLTVFERLPLHPDINSILGDFTNTNLLAVDNSTLATFTVRAREIQQQLLQDLDHIHISGVEVLRELVRRRKTGLTAVMPIVFTSLLGLNSVNTKDLEFSFLGEEVYSISQTPQVWLDHQVTEQKGALVFNWDVVEELFPEGFLDDMFGAYCDLLERLATSESAWVNTQQQLLPQAQLSQRHEVNNTSAPISQQTLHGLFIEQVKIQPQQVAIISNGGNFTYEQIYEKASVLAARLQNLGAIPNNLVAVVMEKGWEQVVAVLGILMSGAAYLPIDPNLPQERQSYLLEQGKVKLVVIQPHLESNFSLPPGVQTICISDDDVETLGVTSLKDQNIENLAYVIYTSGSTGLPKGVVIDHRGAVNTIVDINQRFGVGNSDRILALSALNFDLSVYDIFGMLAAGGTIVIPPQDAVKDPACWYELIVKYGISIWNSVPALMQMLVEYLSSQPQTKLLPLRLALLSGDWLPLNLPLQIQANCSDIQIVSLGGATEASIWSIYYPINTVDPNWKSIPYGKPLTNQQFYVLNELMQPTPVWVMGQLYIGGIGLALGYWRDEQKTKASFITHPVTGERLYKTGDLGRYLPDGNIEFLGRCDFQVKINGYRIELGEIEATLKQHPAIEEAVVNVVEERGNKSLTGYIVKNIQKNISPNFNEIRNFLEAKLPNYMLPSAFMLLESLPLTSNGKIDRRTLPLPNPINLELEKTFVAPRNSIEKLLIETWTEVFKFEKIGIHDNFFDLGGHSFLALQLISKINKKLDINISLNKIFQYPTVAKLAVKVVQNSDDSQTSTYLVPIQAEGTQPPLFCIHPAGGQVMVYQHLAAYLGADRPIFGIQSRAINHLEQEHKSIDKMAVEYAQAIYEHQPHSPYYLMGWSMGGVIGVSVAKELEKQGHKVAFVGLVDSFLMSELVLDRTPNLKSDPFMELALVFGGTFVDAFIALDAVKQQELREELINLTSRQRLQRIMIWGQKRNLLVTDISIDILEKQLNITKIHDRILKVHCSPKIEAPIHVWWASDKQDEILPHTDWSKYTTGESFTKILDGNHFSIIRPPHIQTLAQELQKSLETIN